MCPTFGVHIRKYINLDEINYFAKFSENLSEEDQRKLYSIILIEKCEDTKNLINLYFKGLCCNFCFECYYKDKFYAYR